MGSLLSADERARVARLRFERDKRRYTVGRGLLRTLLGHYQGRDPAQLRFHYLAHGKPALADPAGPEALHFNLSHSAGTVLYGFTTAGPIGVDIEEITPFDELDDVAAHHFSPEELADLHRADVEDRGGAFFRCWTRKESFIKAIGHGLSWPLKSFSVSLLPGEAARLRSLSGDPGAPSRWTLHDLQPSPGLAAAVAVEGPVGQISCWHRAW
jgi:4'-phosphopantetheinyl transferase